MADARGSIVLIAAVLVAACGGSEPRRVDQGPDSPTEERSTNYTVNAAGPAAVCGWVLMPTGDSEYVPCPSMSKGSPISDPPASDEDDLGAVPGSLDPRPEPPGDPPPM